MRKLVSDVISNIKRGRRRGQKRAERDDKDEGRRRYTSISVAASAGDSSLSTAM